jgi:hypothetical protein
VAHYFFHLCDGHEVVIDPEGREIADVAEIDGYALKEARAMIAQDALGGRISLGQYIEVRDETGKLVHQLAFRDAVTISQLFPSPAADRP